MMQSSIQDDNNALLKASLLFLFSASTMSSVQLGSLFDAMQCVTSLAAATGGGNQWPHVGEA